MRRAWLLALVFLAGCGSTECRSRCATVWVTRDRGAHVLHVGKVRAGLSAMQAVSTLAKVHTRYGGRYLRSADGLEEHGQDAWFYYVNGYLADRAATDYRLRAGDVVWWDFRSWRDPAQDPVVVGAFPEPFLHGFDGRRRPAVVIAQDSVAGRRLARLVHGRVATQAPAGANVLRVGRGPERFAASSAPPGGAVTFRFTGDWHLLLRGSHPFRFRYSVP